MLREPGAAVVAGFCIVISPSCVIVDVSVFYFAQLPIPKGWRSDWTEKKPRMSVPLSGKK